MSEEKNSPSKEEIKEELEKISEEIVETKHTIKLGDDEFTYTARAGKIILRYEVDARLPQPKATLFFISYTLDGKKPENRPITFTFNGGPGSSSVWLHMGLFGPKRVVSESKNKPVPPPYELVENEFTLLDKSDFVFIDPVGTGFSRSVPGEKAEQFHSFEKDIESVGEFIRMYLSRYGRWSSPKFLAGESYGTTRAAGLSNYLTNTMGIYLNGVILISTILNFQTARFDTGNDLPYVLFFPTYSAVGWYHKKLSPEIGTLRQTVKKASAFAEEVLLPALFKGAELGVNEKKKIAAQMSELTGISKEFYLRSNLRVSLHQFTRELLRDEAKTVGRLDGRFVGTERDAVGELPSYDPSYATIQGPYTALFNQYVKEELNYSSDENYQILAPLYMKWKYDKNNNSFLDAAELLRKAMSSNPFMEVFVASGYFDGATPFFATRYTFNHMGLDESLLSRVHINEYDGGHMMYTEIGNLYKLRKDFVKFYTTVLFAHNALESDS